MDQLHLRRYCKDDRAACLTLFESNIPDSFLPHEIPGLLDFLDCFTGPYLVAEEAGGRILGCGGMAEYPDYVTLCWGMVARARQRQGIGRVLLRTRLALAACIPGVRRVSLNTSQRTAPFFEKEGFQTRRVTPHFYGSGLHRHDMELRLSPIVRQEIGRHLTAMQEAGHRLAVITEAFRTDC
jgi:GNAT superfamily N-acetyltransferase